MAKATKKKTLCQQATETLPYFDTLEATVKFNRITWM